MSLSAASIFDARPILRNFDAKKSAFIDNHRNCVQILCVVGDSNEILVRYRYYGVQGMHGYLNNRSSDEDDENVVKSVADDSRDTTPRENGGHAARLKLIVWFQRAGKIVQDICFDPSGRHLLVVCYDNTLHIVPILWIIGPEFGLKTTTSQEFETFYWPFRSDEITSFVVPFSGPHECPNSKTCPNNSNAAAHTDEGGPSNSEPTDTDKYTPTQINQIVLANDAYQSFYLQPNESRPGVGLNAAGGSQTTVDDFDVVEKSPDGCEKGTMDGVTLADIQIGAADTNCPFPLSVTWWSTTKIVENSHQHRAIIGYSDGSICVVGLAPNCPYIANTSISRTSGGVLHMTICRESMLKNVSLLITSTSTEQWKLLLEQNTIGYVFPDESHRSNDSSTHSNTQSTDSLTGKQKTPDHGWQIIVPVPQRSAGEPDGDEAAGDADRFEPERTAQPSVESVPDDMSAIPSTSGILPAAARRLISLKDLGARKFGALKMKLIENNAKANERDRNRKHMGQLACMEMPSLVPELLTGPNGPFFIVQYLNNKHYLSALHTHSNTLSVHNMDANFVPLHLYKIPKDCSSVLLTPTIIYTKQMINRAAADAKPQRTDAEHENDENLGFSPAKGAKANRPIEAIGVVGCNSSVLKIGEDSELDPAAVIALFPFPDETIIDIHRVPGQHQAAASQSPDPRPGQTDPATPAPVPIVNERPHFEQPKITTDNYFNRLRRARQSPGDNVPGDIAFAMSERNILEHTFPAIALDECVVVTNRSVVTVQFREPAHIMFLNLVRHQQWDRCEQFCKLFELDFNQCVEYSGDVLLSRKLITPALLAYNAAKVIPIKTALKLAMFGENNALMHLCAMALKIAHVLESIHPKCLAIGYAMLLETNYKRTARSKVTAAERNCGRPTSDFCYERHDTPANLQMTNSSQFHLSNLLLLTLTERAIKDRRLMPLWNFLVTNKRYHTKMSSIVLAQSGLYSSATVLAVNRGAQLDVFCALVGVVNQQFGWYTEFNSILSQLSDTMYMECIIYLQSMAMDYFACLQKKTAVISLQNLERLRHQLDPFTAVYRPVVSQLSANFIESDSNDLNKKLFGFCTQLIETFLIVIMRLYSVRCAKYEITNGLNVIHVNHEHNQFAIKIETGSANISAGFSHAAAIVDGSCYLWGSNGLNCALNGNIANAIVDSASETSPKCLEFMSNMGLEVHAVKCGKTHTLILTNNGLYTMGSNAYQQLGIGRHFAQALQPMLVREFDGKNISLIEAGQYHNAVYADHRLYTYGWNIYGQLGHGHIDTVEKPTVVRFFDDKRVKQIALGHAHTLVLCANRAAAHATTLYVFGCNVFGQLGLGQYEHSNQKFLKSTVPRRFDLIDEPIAQIQTKFFTNFAISQSNAVYTWGASPQYIRLMNQSRKRERLAQRLEETQAHNADGQPSPAGPGDAEPSNKDVADESARPTDSGVGHSEPGASASSESKAKQWKQQAAATLHCNLEERIKSLWRSKSQKRSRDAPANATKPYENGEYVDDEYTDHFYPAAVNTSQVDAEIVQISSGLYHNVLVTSTMQMYVWGRNLEKQLACDDTRHVVTIPTHLDFGDNIIFAECGADFTIYQTDNFTVKAFGNNNAGQCGHEMSGSGDKAMAGKLVRLRVSKRIVRLPDTSHCIDKPAEIPLPRPKIRMNYDAVRYLKSMPSYRPEYISREIFRDAGFSDHSSYSGDNAADSGAPTPDHHQRHAMGPLADRTRNLSLSEAVEVAAARDTQTDVSGDFVHYCLFILHGIYDARKILGLTTIAEFKVRILMLNYYVKEAFLLCLDAAQTTVALHQSEENVHTGNIMLINYVIRLFEYFTKDATVVPIHRTDLKHLIHAIFTYFIEHALHIEPLEAYFLNNVDHYLFGLAFVLFFSNNNTKLERKVQQQYSHLFSGCVSDDNFGGRTNESNSLNTGAGSGGGGGADDDTEQTQPTEQMRDDSVALDFELIFKHVSVRFKTIICQRLIEFDKELN